MERRGYVIAVGTAALTSGCVTPSTTDSGNNGTGSSSLPPECPTSQNYNISIPDGTSLDQIRAFVKEYEPMYIIDNYVDTQDESTSLTAEPSTTVLETDVTEEGTIVQIKTLWSTSIEMEDGEGIRDSTRTAWYFISEQIVRRTENPDIEPISGQLLECSP